MAGHRQVHSVDAEQDPQGVPERTCVVTRQTLEPEDLIRFVLAPDKTVVPDLDRKLPGRGVWVTANRELIEKAVKTRAFSRAFRSEAAADDALGARIETLLVRRTSDTLALANKAGLVSFGFQQVDAALEKGAVALLVHAAEAAEDGCQKLDRKFKAIAQDLGRCAPIVTALTLEQISLAMGRPSVVHAALTSGGLTERFRREAERLVRYRGSPTAPGFAGPDPLEPKAETDKA